MTTYPRSAYKSPFPAGTSPNGAASRGWGPGWPDCQASKMATVVAKDQTKGEAFDIRVTVRREVAAMVADLLEATDKLYDLDQHDTGAYNCRPIAGTHTASNHSWGLAIDINWEENPQSSNFTSHIPPAVVAMWNDCGWFWGGFYAHSTPDTMHFEYIGTPASVAANAKKAAAYNGKAVPAPKPKPKPVKLVPFPGADAFKLGHSNKAVTQLGKWLLAVKFARHFEGKAYEPGPEFTPYDRTNVMEYQLSKKELKSDPDGYPGPLMWKLLQQDANDA